MKRDLRALYEGLSPSSSFSNQDHKRPRRLTSFDDLDCSTFSEGPGTSSTNERRRVNPESLALRLGPDLVRELDALIPPGSTDMPTFAMRKHIQERFNLDRRHIYDYYHSKGLRVVKEDKHTNLARARAQLSANAHARTKRIHTSSMTPSETLRYPGSSSPRQMPARPAAPTSPASSSLERARVESPPWKRYSGSSHQDVRSPKSSASSSPPLSVSAITWSPVDPAPLVNPLEDLFDTDSQLGNSLTNYESGFDVFGWSPRSSSDVAPASSPVNPPLALWLSPHQKPLSKEERLACYSRLDSDLGPPHGIQQLVGSYQMFMMEQSRLYYQRLFPDPYDNRDASHDAPAAPPSGARLLLPSSVTALCDPHKEIDLSHLRRGIGLGHPHKGIDRGHPNSVTSARAAIDKQPCSTPARTPVEMNCSAWAAAPVPQESPSHKHVLDPASGDPDSAPEPQPGSLSADRDHVFLAAISEHDAHQQEQHEQQQKKQEQQDPQKHHPLQHRLAGTLFPTAAAAPGATDLEGSLNATGVMRSIAVGPKTSTHAVAAPVPAAGASTASSRPSCASRAVDVAVAVEGPATRGCVRACVSSTFPSPSSDVMQRGVWERADENERPSSTPSTTSSSASPRRSHGGTAAAAGRGAVQAGVPGPAQPRASHRHGRARLPGTIPASVMVGSRDGGAVVGGGGGGGGDACFGRSADTRGVRLSSSPLPPQRSHRVGRS